MNLYLVALGVVICFCFFMVVRGLLRILRILRDRGTIAPIDDTHALIDGREMVNWYVVAFKADVERGWIGPYACANDENHRRELERVCFGLPWLLDDIWKIIVEYGVDYAACFIGFMDVDENLFGWNDQHAETYSGQLLWITPHTTGAVWLGSRRNNLGRIMSQILVDPHLGELHTGRRDRKWEERFEPAKWTHSLHPALRFEPENTQQSLLPWRIVPYRTRNIQGYELSSEHFLTPETILKRISGDMSTESPFVEQYRVHQRKADILNVELLLADRALVHARNIFWTTPNT